MWMVYWDLCTPYKSLDGAWCTVHGEWCTVHHIRTVLGEGRFLYIIVKSVVLWMTFCCWTHPVFTICLNHSALHCGALEAVSWFFLLIVWSYTKSLGSLALKLSELLNILCFFTDIHLQFILFLWQMDRSRQKIKKKTLKHIVYEMLYRKSGDGICPFAKVAK